MSSNAHLSDEQHDSLMYLYNLLDDMEAGYKCSGNLLGFKLKTNAFPIEVINAFVNDDDYHKYSVWELEHVLHNYPNYKQIHFEDSTLNLLRTEWPETYNYVISLGFTHPVNPQDYHNLP